MRPPTDTNGVVVEFFGVPGAGKSTIAHRLGRRLAADGYPVTEPTYTLVHDRTRMRRYLAKMGYAAFAIGRRPDRALSSGRLLAATDQPTPATAGKLLLNWLFVRGVVDAHRGDGVRLLDQGLSQAVWSVALRADRDYLTALSERAVNTLSRAGPARIVVVEIAPETARDRLEARATDESRISPADTGATIADAFDWKARVEEAIVEAAADEPAVDIVRVRNETSTDLERSTAELYESLAATLP
ncbi:AAA family ATPase [Natronococcus occultus]|uniref:Thymidylate kinase n=1 Tax=Natronococcus occultus SP4 TaxID=694430 RepID=L0K0L1_9EURY|nr:AAA family ATPase [Natronococcus occultus]AGB38812.1 thymidylate kinase [Natronococcus occultus SP4]